MHLLTHLQLTGWMICIPDELWKTCDQSSVFRQNEAMAVVRFTHMRQCILMDDFLFSIWQLKTTLKAWQGHAGVGTDDTLGCTPKTHCECFPETLGVKSAYSINSIKKPQRRPIISLFFHIIPYLHKKQPVNYLTRGVKKTFQIVAAEENEWALITTIWPPMC